MITEKGKINNKYSLYTNSLPVVCTLFSSRGCLVSVPLPSLHTSEAWPHASSPLPGNDNNLVIEFSFTN